MHPPLRFLVLLLTVACTRSDVRVPQAGDSSGIALNVQAAGRVAAADSQHAEGRRAALSPITLSRVMIDPTSVSDDKGEWIEIANSGRTRKDLRGWTLASGHDAGFVIAQSLVVPAKQTVMLGHNGDSATNGGVHIDLAYAGITLGNGNDWLVLRDSNGVTVDSLAWTHAPSGSPLVHPATGGVSADTGASLAPAASGQPSPTPGTPAAAPKEVVVRLLDVGQGDAVLIQNGGSTVLVDGGPTPAALGHHLDALGLNNGTIDAVILTHAHADHYQGLRELFVSKRRITVRYFWENQDPSPNVTLGKLRDSIAARVHAGTLTYRDTDDPCANGTPVCTLTLKGGAKIEIMRPEAGAQAPNNHSPAVKLVGPDSASFTMWMAGDAEHEAIDWFRSSGGYQMRPGMQVDVLKADHHGSCNGVTDQYLDLLKPSLLVVSLGAVNDYGHMHDQAKAMYQRHGIPWYRTDQNGTITLRSAGTPGSRYTVSVERGTTNLSGPSDRRSTAPECRAM